MVVNWDGMKADPTVVLMVCETVLCWAVPLVVY